MGQRANSQSSDAIENQSVGCDRPVGLTREEIEILRAIELGLQDSNVCLVGDREPFLEAIEIAGVFEYRGTVKKFLTEMAVVFVKEEIEKPTVENLKEAIASYCVGKTALIVEAQRLPLSLRFWLDEIELKIVFQTLVRQKKDIFLDCLTIDLPKLSQSRVREVLQEEASAVGLALSKKRIIQLAGYCGQTRTEIRRLIRREKLGFLPDYKLPRGDYLDISPLVLAGFCGFGIMRFAGIATGNRSLYIVGGISMMIGLMLKNLSRFGK